MSITDSPASEVSRAHTTVTLLKARCALNAGRPSKLLAVSLFPEPVRPRSKTFDMLRWELKLHANVTAIFELSIHVPNDDGAESKFTRQPPSLH